MKLFLRVAVLILLSILFVPVSFAKGNRTPSVVVLSKSETVNRDYFAAGDTVNVSGTINGDAYIAGGTVFIDGTINGDLLVAGGTVRIDGAVKNDIRALGGSVAITGSVGGNVTVGAGNLTISRDATIKGSLLTGSGTIELMAPVGKHVTMASGNAVIGSKISGDITAAAKLMIFQPQSSVAGNVTYWSETEATFLPHATISGTTIRYPLPKTDYDPSLLVEKKVRFSRRMLAGFAAIMTLISAVAFFVSGLLFSSLLPVFTDKTLAELDRKAAPSFVAGFFSMIALPILVITAFVTVIGIPVGLLIAGMFAVYWYIGHIFAAFFVGKTVTGWFGAHPHRTVHLLIGIIVLAVLSFIPVLGWLVRSVLVLTGAGAILATKYATYKQLRTKGLI